AVFSRPDAAEISIQPAQADETCGLKQPRLHHQHKSRAARDRAHAPVPGIQKRNRFFECRRFSEFKRFHMRALRGMRSSAAFRFAPNSFATSALFARTTGSPSPPSFPVRLTPAAYRISVWPGPASESSNPALAPTLPARPIASPVIFASMELGGSTFT